MASTRPEIDIHPRTLLPAELQKRSSDVVIIGGGPGGMTAAENCVSHGLSTLIVESELVGGECHFWGCVPSKALLRPSEVIDDAKDMDGAKEQLKIQSNGTDGASNGPDVDLKAVWGRRDRFADHWKDDGLVKMLQGTGVEIVHGFGGIVGEKKVAIKDWSGKDEVTVEATSGVIIATGSIPVIPKITGLEECGYWIPREAVSASEVPEHLLIIGAGAVGTEMATAYARFGSKVTLFVRGEHVLAKAEPEARQSVRKGLEALGVDVQVNARAEAVERKARKVTLRLSDGRSFQGTELLIAAGRRARTDGMGLHSVGAEEDGAWISVDSSSRLTKVPSGWLYAIGDPNNISATTHMSMYQSYVATNSIIAQHKGTRPKGSEGAYSILSMEASRAAIPQVVFTDPQVASVGLTAAAAESKGLQILKVSKPIEGPGTALHSDNYEGWAQWVVEKETGRLLGATFVGRNAVDLLHASTVAIVGRMTVYQLWHAVTSFPTFTEIYGVLAVAAVEQLEAK